MTPARLTPVAVRPGGRPVQGAEVGEERSVVGGDHGQMGKPGGVEGPDQGVVVHDVVVRDRLVDGQYVVYLGGRAGDADPASLLEGPVSRYREGAVV